MLAHIQAGHLSHAARRCVVWIARHRTASAGGAALAVVVAIAIVIGSKTAGSAPLFDAPLRDVQVTEVGQALTLWGEPFTTNPQGTQVYVAAGRRRGLLLKLALAGVPHRYVYSSADVLAPPSNPLGLDDRAEDRRRSAVAGDLTNSLRHIDGVRDVSVIIAAGSADPFSDAARSTPPSASVQLIMQPGASLSATAVDGIKRFVAGSYAGLTPERVTIVDADGELRGAPPVADRGVGRERRLQSLIQTALDAVLGAGHAVVRASVRASGVTLTTQSTRVVPHGLIDADSGRELGVDAGKRFDKQRTRRHYAYDTVTEHRSSGPDTIARISVAVFLDADVVPASQTGAIERLVQAAAGADLHAGDEVVVQSMSFARRAPAIAAPPQPGAPRKMIAAFTGALAIAAFGAAFALWGRERAVLPAPVRTPLADDDRALAASLASEAPCTAAFVLRDLPPLARERVLSALDLRRRESIMAYLAAERADV